MRKAATAAVMAACFFGMTSFALAASTFEGVWKVKDTAGHPFEITLSSGGVAKATRGEGMKGTWKEEKQFSRNNLEHRLDDENNEGGQSICQNSVWQGPVANRDTGEHLGRRKGQVNTARA